MTDASAAMNPVDLHVYRSRIEGRPVLLFDGVCGLCNRSVHFLLQRDHRAILRFVPLESPLGHQLLSTLNAWDAPEGVVLITGVLTPAALLLRRTEAISEALILIGGKWRVLGRLTRLVPRSLCEFGYSVIARYRYRIFGKYSTCPIPTPAQRERILGIH